MSPTTRTTSPADDGALPVAPGAARESAPALELRAIEKRFGGVRALRGANFTIPADRGIVAGLLGENGSGKSTLLGVLSGQLRPDSGEILLGGQHMTFASPLAAMRHGIAMVAQETAVLPDLTVAENIMLGRRLSRTPAGINWRDVRRRAQSLLERLELDYDTDAIVGRLRPDQQQMVEIARVLATDARILILDEPTSSLTDGQASALFGVLRRLRDQGVATIFVSHRIEEVMGLVDELTILRDGRTVCSDPISQFTADRIVEEMVGRKLIPQTRLSALPDVSGGGANAALRVRELTVPGKVSDVDLEIAPGRIVGLAGLVGAGRSDILEAIFGLTTTTTGQIELFGKPVAAGSPRRSIDAGIGYLPPDRKLKGLVLSMTVRENLTMISTLTKSRFGPPRAAEERPIVDQAFSTMGLRAASPEVLAATLSGGNQQKVALGKWLAQPLKCLLLDEPTRGVDAAAKMEIHRILRQAARSGLAMLVSSSEYDELLELSDEILVVFRGRITARLSRDNADQATIARYAGGYS